MYVVGVLSKCNNKVWFRNVKLVPSASCFYRHSKSRGNTLANKQFINIHESFYSHLYCMTSFYRLYKGLQLAQLKLLSKGCVN